MRIERDLVFRNETLWKYKFGENVENPVIGSIYVSKSVFGKVPPKQIKVIIEG